MPSKVDARAFRAYDIRALVPELVDERSVHFASLGTPATTLATLDLEDVELIGRGIADFLREPAIVVGYDTRLSSPAWAMALARGITRQGCDVIDIGLATTDAVYYASGKFNVPAIEITASHCTRELNGMKIVRSGARVVGSGSGMEELRDIVLSGQFAYAPGYGTVSKREILPEYIDHLMQFVDVDAVRPYKIVADAGNGVGGIVARELFNRIPQIDATMLYFEPDGHFPNHDANPFERENVEELIAMIPATGADFGVAWDGDADRCFFFDETGAPVPGDFVTTLVARDLLIRNPGAAIVYDIRASWAVRDWIFRLGGKPVSERVGHSFIKQTMRASNAVFGGEVSGHYYFRDHYYADNGFIPLLSMLQMLSTQHVPMSSLVASLGPYYVTGEINSAVPDTSAVMSRIREAYSDGAIDERDGISVEFPDWHFNVRPSANDPLVRLNLEARSLDQMHARCSEVLRLIRMDAQ